MRALWLLLLLLPLAGCVDEAPDDGSAPAPTLAPTTTKAPLPDYPDHRQYGETERVAGAVGVERLQDGRYRAVQEVLWSNGFGDATHATLDVGTRNGALAIGTFDAGVYALRVRLWAEAGTETEARDRLAGLQVDVADAMDDGLHLGAHLNATDTQDRGASFILAVPAGVRYDLRATTTDPLVVTDIDATRLVGQAGGTALLRGRVDDLDLRSDGSVKLETGRLGTRPASWNVTAARSLQALLEGSAWDLEADGATVSVDLPGTSPVGTQTETHAHVRGPGAATTVTLLGKDVSVTPP